MEMKPNTKKIPSFTKLTACAILALATISMGSDSAFAQQASGSGKQAHGKQSGSGGQGGGGHGAGNASGGQGKGRGGIFRDLTGADDPISSRGDSDETASDDGDASDRPEWASQPGGKDGAGGGRPATSGSKKGDLFGDLWVILRDANGIPILSPEGFVQPLDLAGNLIPLDNEGHPIDESRPFRASWAGVM